MLSGRVIIRYSEKILKLVRFKKRKKISHVKILLTWKFYSHGNFTYMEKSVECLIAQGNLNIVVRRPINHHPDLGPDPQLTWVHNI